MSDVDEDVAAVREAEKEGFSSVFEAEPSKEPSAKPAPTEPKQQTEAAPAPKVETPADPWAGKDPFYKERFEAQERQWSERFVKLENDYRREAGRVSALQSAIDKTVREAKDATNAGEQAPSQQQIRDAFKSPESLKALSEEWPDVGNAITDALAHTRDSIIREIGPRTTPVDEKALREQVRTEVLSEVEERLNHREITRQHPNWQQEIKSDGFQSFMYEGGPSAEEQAAWRTTDKETRGADRSPYVNMTLSFANKYPQWWADRGYLLESSNPEDAIKAIDRFREAIKAAEKSAKSADRRKERLDAAVSPQGTGAAPPASNEREEAQRAFSEQFKS